MANGHVIEKKEVVTRLNACKTALEAMEIAGLTWTVEQSELMTRDGLDVESHKALIRSDTHKVLAVVGHEYEPLQNHQAFAFFDTVCEKFGARYEYAYCLQGGAKILLQAKINGGFDLPASHEDGKDHVDKFVTLLERRGGGSVISFSTTIRAFCTNQLNSMLDHSADCMNIRHSSNTEERVREAMEAMGMSIKWFTVFQQKAEFLAQKIVDKQMVSRFLDTVIGLPITKELDENKNEVMVEHPRVINQRESVVDLFEHGVGNHGENCWQLVNAVTEFVDHHKNEDNADKRYTSAMVGNGNKVKSLALETAMAL